jgi:ABC-2 type transport system permease protein
MHVVPQPRLFQPVLWQLAWREARLLWLALGLLMAVFGVIFVWIMSNINIEGFSRFLAGAFSAFEGLSGVPFEDLATPAGKIALAFVDPVVILVMTVWGVSRGSDMVSGELDRGTYELLLAQPVRRMSVFLAKAGMAILGALGLALVLWAGLVLGVWLIGGQFADLSGWQFWPGAVNVFGLGFFLLGVSSLVSAPDRYRWRTVGIMGACYATWLLCKLIYKLGGPDAKWIGWFTPFVAFEPQHLVKHADHLRDQLVYNGSLFSLGLICYVLAALIFARRDLPAPL